MWILLLLACEPEPIFPDDPLEGWEVDNPGGADGALPGPVPFEEGDRRLSVGVFYEGGASDLIPIDDVESFYYIYADEFSGQVTYGQTASPRRVEGFESALITHGGGEWWGGGVTWNTPRDLSEWTALYVSARTASDAFTGFSIAIGTTGGEGRVLATDLGFAPNDEWHHLRIDLDAVLPNRTAVINPIILVGEGAGGGEQIYIDNVYFTAE